MLLRLIHCILIFVEKVNWILAQQFCVYHNMSLVSIMDKSANLRLVKELEKRGTQSQSFHFI